MILLYAMEQVCYSAAKIVIVSGILSPHPHPDVAVEFSHQAPPFPGLVPIRPPGYV